MAERMWLTKPGGFATSVPKVFTAGDMHRGTVSGGMGDPRGPGGGKGSRSVSDGLYELCKYKKIPRVN